MKRIIWIFLVLGTGLFGDDGIYKPKPSDCVHIKDHNSTEYTICMNDVLHLQNDSINDLYEKALGVIIEEYKDYLIENQTRWLEKRKECGQDIRCIYEIHLQRYPYLKEYRIKYRDRKRDDRYYLVVSKEPKVCQFTYRIFNDDLEKYGKLELEKRKEFQAIKWDKKFEFFTYDGEPTRHCKSEDIGCKEGIFDINNDGKDEMVAFQDRSLRYKAFNLNSFEYRPFDGNNTTRFYYGKNVRSSYMKAKDRKLKEFPIFSVSQFVGKYSGRTHTIKGTLSLSSQQAVIKLFKFNNQIYMVYGGEEIYRSNPEIHDENRELNIEGNGLIAVRKIDKDNQVKNLCVLIRARVYRNN